KQKPSCQQEKAAIEARAKEAEAKADSERRLREEEQKHREELEVRIKTKKYKAVARDEFVYIMKESSELHNNKHKIGKTINISNRKSNFQTSHASKVEIVHQVPMSNAHVVEQVVHSLLRRYHHGKEFYNCEITHSINLINYVSKMYDTLSGCYEFITEEEIAAKLHECIDAGVSTSAPSSPSNPVSAKRGRKQKQQCITQFISDRCVFGPDEKVHWRHIWKAYKDWKEENPGVPGHYDGKVTFFNVIKPKIWSHGGVVKKDSLNIDGDSRDGVLGFGLQKGCEK
ncbi:hypothetical protein HK102_007528, partial [Quaeritorhiza haematococci]